MIRFRPERTDEVIGVATPPDEQYALLDRLGFEHRDDGGVAPTWRARDVTREIDVVEEVARFRLEDVPFTLPGSARDVRHAHARAAAPPPRRGRARRPRVRGDVHAEPRPRRRHAVEAARADLGRADRAAHDAPPEPRRGRAPERRRGRAADRALRDRARVPRRAASSPTSGSASPGSPRAASSAPRASSRRCTRLSRRSRRSSAPSIRCSIPGKTARTRAGVVGELHPRALDGEWGAFELDLEELLAAAREPVTYEDVITYPAIRQDIAVVVPEEVEAGDWSSAAREAAGRRAARDARVFDVYRGEQVAPGREVGRVLGRVPVARPHARPRRTRRGSVPRSSPRSPSASAPSSGRSSVAAARVRAAASPWMPPASTKPPANAPPTATGRCARSFALTSVALLSSPRSFSSDEASCCRSRSISPRTSSGPRPFPAAVIAGVPARSASPPESPPRGREASRAGTDSARAARAPR